MKMSPARVIGQIASAIQVHGTLYGTTVDLSGEMIKDAESEMRIAMARQ